MKIMTFYDGTIQAKAALRYGIARAKEDNGELVVLHVFQSSLFIDYDAGPRAEEIAREEAKRFVQEAENIIREEGRGIPVRVVSEEGDPEQEIVRLATNERPDLLLVAPRYKGVVKSSPCPVYVIPGVILVPVDNSDALRADIDLISREAVLTGSSVLLMGIVPIHLYNVEEKAELELIREQTQAAVQKTGKLLLAKGLTVSDIVRSGYPDEEILKAADEYGVSLIMLPAGGESPSELTKAAAVLLDEPQRVRKPVYLMRPVAA